MPDEGPLEHYLTVSHEPEPDVPEPAPERSPGPWRERGIMLGLGFLLGCIGAYALIYSEMSGGMRTLKESLSEERDANASLQKERAPLLEKLEQNDGNLTLRGKTYHVEVPQRVQQAVIPVLAVGLYYGIDSGTVAAMARYIFMFMSMKPDSADVAVRAAFCHHCEDYISLMEYYPPADHGMEAYTRA